MGEESVLVTGGGSGMGQLASRQLANAGYNVAAVDVNEKEQITTIII